jgi:pyridoxal 5'-phosphate synthase pdxT subunit
VRVGVLALQGDFREHLAVLGSLGTEAVEVRTPAELEAVDALVIPGGESTTIGRLATIFGLIDPLRRRIEDGMPVLGTCAGLIFLAAATTGRPQPLLGVLDVVVERNAFGRQVDSFEADLTVSAPGIRWERPLHAVFIRAPLVDKAGEGVEILAAVEGDDGRSRPVFVKQGNILALSFHPEIAGESRVHEMMLELIDEER